MNIVYVKTKMYFVEMLKTERMLVNILHYCQFVQEFMNVRLFTIAVYHRLFTIAVYHFCCLMIFIFTGVYFAISKLFTGEEKQVINTITYG